MKIGQDGVYFILHKVWNSTLFCNVMDKCAEHLLHVYNEGLRTALEKHSKMVSLKEYLCRGCDTEKGTETKVYLFRFLLQFRTKDKSWEFPQNEAKCRTDQPSLVRILEQAPNFTNSWTCDSFPSEQNTCKGVWPSLSYLFTSMLM